MLKKILLTGHDGYVGAVMAPYLVERGYDVTGLDTGYYGDCALVPLRRMVPAVKKDIRDVELADVKGFDAVIHLAALSNDFVGDLNPSWTGEINFRASVRLAELSRAAGVQRFLFSSSCIMYGMSEAAVVTEESPLDPKTDYARSKVDAERAITKLASDTFSPVFLRNGTIYGLSPRMRFDTVLNNLVGAAVAAGKVTLNGDGKPWRPVVHVQDVARAFAHVLEAPREVVHNQAFNNGQDSMNHQILELGQVAASVAPGATLEVLSRADADQRTYKTVFAKFKRAFPGFTWKWDIRSGAKELSEAFRKAGLKGADFTDKRFTRLKWLRHLLDQGRLDSGLRWKAGERSLR